MEPPEEISLPPELWLFILSFVRTKDLCSVALVCSTLYHVAKDPKLWAKISINKKKIKTCGVSKVFEMSRFSRIISLDLSYMPLTVWDCTTIFDNVIHSKTIKSVSLHFVNLSGLDSDVLGRGISILQKVDLSGSKLTTLQCTAILNHILSSQTIQDISLRNVNLSLVDTSLVSKATSRLAKADLEYTMLTPDQVTGILLESLSSVSLLDLDLSYNTLSSVPPELLSKAVCRLHRVGLKFTKLTTDQVTSIITTSLDSTSLQDISLYRVNLSDVPFELLMAAKNKFKMYF